MLVVTSTFEFLCRTLIKYLTIRLVFVNKLECSISQHREIELMMCEKTIGSSKYHGYYVFVKVFDLTNGN